MGFPLRGCEAPAGDTVTLSGERPAEEARLASIAYLAWPLAAYDRIAPRDTASSWYRFHMRQALWFGILSSAIGFAALAWPLLISLLVGDVGATIWLYAIALTIDAFLFCIWLVLALRYSRRAAAGDLFDVPWVVGLTGASSSRR